MTLQKISDSGLGAAPGRFGRLIAGQGASAFGSRITEIALPLSAISLFDAPPWQVGLLATLAMLPNLVLSIPAGAWIDRSPPRTVMMSSAVGRVVLMSTIPIAYFAGLLTLMQLYVVAVAIGCLTVLYDTALVSYLPWLVGRKNLVVARSRQTAVEGLADIGGQSAGGALVELIGAVMTAVVDAISYLVCLLFLRKMPKMDPADPGARTSAVSRIKEGLVIGWKNRANRYTMLEAGHYNLFFQAFLVIFVIYVVRDLNLGGFVIGFSMAALSLGSVVGAALAPYISRRLGIGGTIVGGLLLGDLAAATIPILDHGTQVGAGVFALALFVAGFGGMISGVLVIALVLAVTPSRAHGRITGARRVITRGGTALGGLLGGTLLTFFESRTALAICAVGMVTAVLWVLNPAVSRVRELPTDPA